MIDFSRSTFTWKTHPWLLDAYYRYPGGFVGKPCQVYQVRFNIQACCTVQDLDLLDPNNRPLNYPPPRPRPTVFNEVWELKARNIVMCDENT